MLRGLIMIIRDQMRRFNFVLIHDRGVIVIFAHGGIKDRDLVSINQGVKLKQETKREKRFLH